MHRGTLRTKCCTWPATDKASTTLPVCLPPPQDGPTRADKTRTPLRPRGLGSVFSSPSPSPPSPPSRSLTSTVLLGYARPQRHLHLGPGRKIDSRRNLPSASHTRCLAPRDARRDSHARVTPRLAALPVPLDTGRDMESSEATPSSQRAATRDAGTPLWGPAHIRFQATHQVPGD